MKYIIFALVIAAMTGCRTSQPPAISIICIGDGFGGADCVTSAGNKKYLAQSDLLNFWMTTEVDQQNFSNWCYDTSLSTTKSAMNAIKANIKSP